MKVGDKVTWTVATAKKKEEKVGYIAMLLKAGERYDQDAIAKLLDAKPRSLAPKNTIRSHDSYVVVIPRERSKPLMYWPRVADLRRVA